MPGDPVAQRRRVLALGDENDVPDHPHRRAEADVISVENATHDIRRIRLVMEGQPLAFAASQYARVAFLCAPTRDYSIASQPGRKTIDFHVRHVHGGAASERVAKSLKVGDRVGIEGPFGSSDLREQHAGPILAIAGGLGLAPMKSIVVAAMRRRLTQPIRLYFGARRKRDLYLVDHLTSLAKRHPNLAFVPALSDAGGSPNIRTGFVSDAVAADIAAPVGWKAFLAGPPAMIDASLTILAERGIKRDDVHADVFFTPQDVEAGRGIPNLGESK